MVNIIELNELVTGFSFAVPAVLANRLLISIREEGAYKGLGPGETELSRQTQLGWRAVTGPSDTTEGLSSDEIDLSTFPTRDRSTLGSPGVPLSAISGSATAVGDERSERGPSSSSVV